MYACAWQQQRCQERGVQVAKQTGASVAAVCRRSVGQADDDISGGISVEQL